ncbi:hypothetical protein LAZ67_14003513 [Cordylochernes scorpioides]|uniref:Uncharacterized protein n=1 Tax=Cordylochernes scorpioides TaxID=51811 RepID=A0ABY6L7R2_9ARAC|nr:hypothetical protein LAZ67_14003513 [Cordylochernes scorpioides]
MNPLASVVNKVEFLYLLLSPLQNLFSLCSLAYILYRSPSCCISVDITIFQMTYFGARQVVTESQIKYVDMKFIRVKDHNI